MVHVEHQGLCINMAHMSLINVINMQGNTVNLCVQAVVRDNGKFIVNSFVIYFFFSVTLYVFVCFLFLFFLFFLFPPKFSQQLVICSRYQSEVKSTEHAKKKIEMENKSKVVAS